MIKAIMASPIVRKTAAAAMFMTAVAGMGTAKAENRTPKSDYTTATNEILPAAYPLVQTQVNKGTYSKEHHHITDRKVLLITANKEEYDEYINTRYNEIGTFDCAYEVQSTVDVSMVGYAVEQAIDSMGDLVFRDVKDFWKERASQFNEWLVNNFYKTVVELENEYKICVDGSPNSAERVIDFLEETFSKYGAYSSIEDADRDFSEYKKAKDEYLNKYGIPKTTQEKANYISFLRYTQDSILFKSGLKFYGLSSFIPLMGDKYESGTWQDGFEKYANPLVEL